MILDTSAVLAILRDEPERRTFTQAIEQATACAMSAASFVEASIVLESRYGPDGVALLDTFLLRGGVEIVPVDRPQAEAARLAYRRFGKGRHAAGLNFGDCFAFALSQVSDRPLLFKGEDFARTDVRPAAR